LLVATSQSKSRKTGRAMGTYNACMLMDRWKSQDAAVRVAKKGSGSAQVQRGIKEGGHS
jgi:hypothetical protein